MPLAGPAIRSQLAAGRNVYLCSTIAVGTSGALADDAPILRRLTLDHHAIADREALHVDRLVVHHHRQISPSFNPEATVPAGELRAKGDRLLVVDLGSANGTWIYRDGGHIEVDASGVAAIDGDIVMTLTKKECSDGMSDRKYPWEASVAYRGQTLKGCGASKDYMKETAQ